MLQAYTCWQGSLLAAGPLPAPLAYTASTAPNACHATLHDRLLLHLSCPATLHERLSCPAPRLMCAALCAQSSTQVGQLLEVLKKAPAGSLDAVQAGAATRTRPYTRTDPRPSRDQDQAHADMPVRREHPTASTPRRLPATPALCIPAPGRCGPRRRQGVRQEHGAAQGGVLGNDMCSKNVECAMPATPGLAARHRARLAMGGFDTAGRQPRCQAPCAGHTGLHTLVTFTFTFACHVHTTTATLTTARAALASTAVALRSWRSASHVWRRMRTRCVCVCACVERIHYTTAGQNNAAAHSTLSGGPAHCHAGQAGCPRLVPNRPGRTRASRPRQSTPRDPGIGLQPTQGNLPARREQGRPPERTAPRPPHSTRPRAGEGGAQVLQSVRGG
jgi:hypothetical protein